MEIQFNMNDRVEVRLTKFGAEVVNSYYDRYRQAAPSLEWPAYKQGDVMREQLWSVMQIFGEHIHMGMVEVPFERNKITLVTS